jgi:hypothetical protein
MIADDAKKKTQTDPTYRDIFNKVPYGTVLPGI